MAGMTEKMVTVRTWFYSTMEYLKVQERMALAVGFAKERPVAATLIGVAIATSLLPTMAFVSFVVTFLVVGVVTLLIIEGTAVLSAIVILVFALFGSMIAAVFIGMFLLSGLVAGRFAWRMTSPVRTKLAARMGMYHEFGPDNKMAPEEKCQTETDPAPDIEYISRMTYEADED